MYDDLDRPPLRGAALARALAPDGWRVEVVERTESTNSDVCERVRAGEPAGLVLVAEQQRAGRGRLDREWVSPARAGLTLSVLLRPELPAGRLGWLPLWGGLAVARALREHAGVDAVLKWPNDVLIGGGKACGLLAEVPSPGAVVLGIGLNVTNRPAELPPGGTSLQLQGASTTDRDTLLRAVLRELGRAVRQADPAGYRALCATVGSPVRLHLPDGSSVEGTAEQVDDLGRLVVAGRAYSVADVVHLR